MSREIRIEIPSGAMDAITAMDSGCFYYEAIIDGDAAIIFAAKIPLEEDIVSLCSVELLPISFTSQAIKTPHGRILRMEIEMCDDPEASYIVEVWANILDRTQKEEIERLKTQTKTLFLLYDANNTQRCVKGVTLSPEMKYGLNRAIDVVEEEAAVRFDDAKIWAMSRFEVGAEGNPELEDLEPVPEFKPEFKKGQRRLL